LAEEITIVGRALVVMDVEMNVVVERVILTARARKMNGIIVMMVCVVIMVGASVVSQPLHQQHQQQQLQVHQVHQQQPQQRQHHTIVARV